MADIELAAALRLLFSNYERGVVTATVNEVMVLPERDRRRLICPHCGSDDLTFRADITWDSSYNQYECNGDNIDNCWCTGCGGETHDSEVAYDYVHPNRENKSDG